MHKMKLMLAIPVLRSRVAPVFNWCSRICIFTRDGLDCFHLREEMEPGNLKAFNRLEALRTRGVQTLICGALSPDLLTYGEQIGLRIIPGVAGEIDEVVKAFESRELDKPRFWTPGCKGPRRYRGLRSRTDAPVEDSSPSGGGDEQPSASSGRQKGVSTGGQGAKKRGGPGGVCACPLCGKTVQHRRGIPCSQQLCPSCQQSMMRE